MKILYLSGATGADYQCDMLFHGLRTLLGPDCVDVNFLEFMYQGTPYPPFFSIYGLLPRIDVDRTDIVSKIKNHYFDAVVYGSIQRYQEFLSEVCAAYPSNKIALIDGEDDNVICSARGRGWYFKRELTQPDTDLLPIQFAIPKEKILWEPQSKAHLMAPCDPRDRSTYIYYGSEASYYEQYATSYFGRTMKKGGWDACRHYEIMAAGCVPYFEGLENCPSRTLGYLPKLNLLVAKEIHDHWTGSPKDLEDWEKVLIQVHASLYAHLTTEVLAKRVLERLS
jgi:hypothetical protein